MYIHTNIKNEYNLRKARESVDLNIIISNSAGVPIYEQIVSQIKGNIISGEVKEGEMLPSIRNLAKDLKISVITTKRAYEELEREGFIPVSYTHLPNISRQQMQKLVAQFIIDLH